MKIDGSGKPTWGMRERIHNQICRYNPGDERPAPRRAMAINGPLLRLAIQNGKRAWMRGRGGINGPVSMCTVSEMIAVGLFDECHAYVDFEIDDGDKGGERFCLWTLNHTSLDMPTLEFIGPTYRQLQAIRGREVEKRKIASSTKRPSVQKGAAGPRGRAL